MASPQQAARKQLGRRPTTALLVGIVVLAAYTRLANLAGVFVAGQVYFLGQDSHYHVRRALLTVDRFPFVPLFDSYVNHPSGGQLNWPVGFDLLLASACKLVALFDDDPHTLEATAALFDPLLGVGLCIVVALLAGRLAGRLAAVVAGLLVAVMPVLVGYSNVGRVDHHAAEPYLVVVPLLLLVHGLRAPVNKQGLRSARAAGAVLAASIVVWPGAIVVSAIAFGSLLLLVLHDWRDRRRCARWCAMARDTFAVATLVMVPLSWVHPWAASHGLVHFAPSWFQPFCLLAAWLGFEALRVVRRRDGARWQAVVAVGAAAALMVLVGAALSESLRITLLGALGYLGRSEAQISQVTESRPLLAFGLAHLHDHYTLLAYLAPVLLFHGVAWLRATPVPRRGPVLLFVLWLSATLVLALAQLRLGSLFAPLWCIGWAVAARDGWRWLRARTERRALRGAAATAALLAVIGPVAPLYQPSARSGTEELVRSLGALDWLRRHAARPGDVSEPTVRPAFAVMSRWQWGHWINYLGQQANVANPFGQSPAELDGVRSSVRFFMSADPATAMSELERVQGRYVLVAPVIDELGSLLRHTGEPLSHYLAQAPDGTVLVERPFFETIHSRLLHFDGRRVRLDDDWLAPLRRLRLVYESRSSVVEAGRPVSFAKIFEQVAGARIVVDAEAGRRVMLRLPLQTNLGRPLTYRDEAHATADGQARFQVPYATERGAGGGGVVALGACEITEAGQSPITVEISERCVHEGCQVRGVR